MSSRSTVTVGRFVVDALREEGVRFVFGLPGGHVLGIYDALYDTPEIATSSSATSSRPPAWRRRMRS